MKKILSFILAAILLLSLTACNQAETKTVTLHIEDSGILGQYVLEAEDNVVHTITQTTTMDCTGFVEDQFAIIEESIAEYKAIYEAIEGVTYNVEVTDTSMVETLIIDATNKETLNALSSQGLMPMEEGDFIALDKTVESMCAEGWVVAESSTDK
ncbi:MAG: DUF1307 domain-containing protein [Lachnospiraceae bacterium]|nr:DUF1307 domain-containing protein [Lachnospiraceae bacterium]